MSDERRLIGLHIQISTHPAMAAYYGHSNYVASEIWAELLRAKLQTEVKTIPSTFHRSTYVILSGNLGSDLVKVRTELERFRLLENAEVAWLDDAEDVWRPWHPAGEARDFARFVTAEAQQAQMVEFRALNAAAMAAAAQIAEENEEISKRLNAALKKQEERNRERGNEKQ